MYLKRVLFCLFCTWQISFLGIFRNEIKKTDWDERHIFNQGTLINYFSAAIRIIYIMFLMTNKFLFQKMKILIFVNRFLIWFFSFEISFVLYLKQFFRYHPYKVYAVNHGYMGFTICCITSPSFMEIDEQNS